MDERTPVIVAAKRTPIGSFLGSLSTVSVIDLGAIAIKAAMDAVNLDRETISEVIMGNVLPAGVGQAPARQAALMAGVPHTAGAMTINKVCGSGLKAVMLAAQAIQLGDADVVIAGGMENMSLIPYLLSHARTGFRMGNATLVDSMMSDGLIDSYGGVLNGKPMGAAAELCAKEQKVSREAQDAFALQSYERALAAIEGGLFESEITPVSVPVKRGDPTVVDVDEEPGRGTTEAFPNMRPVFAKDGTVTVGNASSINDGAAALIIMSAGRASTLGLTPLASIVAYSTRSKEPEWFTTAPTDAINSLLAKTGTTTDEVDLWEINEAFAVVSIANNRLLELDGTNVNVWGGAVALGHPVGASGARILTTLLHSMIERDVNRGIASACIGGGEAVALMVER